MTFLYLYSRDNVFYGDMVLYLGAVIGLYAALSYLVVVMQSTATPTFTLMNEERHKISRVVSVFGVGYLAGSLITAVKAFMWKDFVGLVEDKPALYYMCALFVNVALDMLPVALLYSLHKANFYATE